MKKHGLVMTAVAAVVMATAWAHAAERPNVVLVMADDQGWGDMAYNGHPVLKTPHFDAMAAEALRFDRFYAAAPVCSPTRASVLTGRHPNRTNVFSWGHAIRPQEVTLAEVLRDVGYVTGHFGKWHLGSVQKDSPVNPGANGFDEWLSAPNFYDNDPILSRESVAVQKKGESSMVAVDAAIEFMRKHAGGDQPFLSVVWFGSPHRPHRAVEQDRTLYPEQSEKLQNFYGEITGMDRAFGKLRNEIQELGIREHTILWYCSDNGGLPDVGSTGGREHKGEIYEGGLKVPAILEWPAVIKEPRTTDIPCNTSDIYPTLLDLLDIAVDDQPPLDGVSLRPLIEGDMAERPKAMGFWEYPSKGVSTPSAKLMAELLEAQKNGKDVAHPDLLRMDAAEIQKQYPVDAFPGHAAWLDWPWKLHRIEANNGDLRFELYNLADDPMEEHDRAETEPARVKAMKAALDRWQRSVVRGMNGGDYD